MRTIAIVVMIAAVMVSVSMTARADIQGMFYARRDYRVADYGKAIALGDFNEDGHEDMVVADGDGVLSLLLGDGWGRLTSMAMPMWTSQRQKTTLSTCFLGTATGRSRVQRRTPSKATPTQSSSATLMRMETRT
jgi:hypothetical protein